MSNSLKVDFSVIASVGDFAYKFCQYADRATDIVARARLNIPGFPDAMSDDVIAQFKAGAALRKRELPEEIRYSKEGADRYVPDENGGFVMNYDIAMGYTSHEFGQLKAEYPNLHAMVKTIREAVTKYTSKRLANLKAMAKAQEPAAARGQADNFEEYLAKRQEESITRRNNAEKKGTPCMSATELTARWNAFHSWKPKAKA